MTDHEKLIALLAYIDGAIGNSEFYASLSVKAYKEFKENLMSTVDNTENK